MVRNVLSLLLLLVAIPVFAGGVAVHPTAASVRVGERITLRAADEPGGLSTGFPYNVTFDSDDPSVAEIHGYASGTGYLQPYPYPNNGTVFVTGVAPGVAHVIAHGSTAKFATITVTGEIGLTVTPTAATVRSGDTVSLVAMITGGYQNVTLEWFLGRIGDTSHLLTAGPILSRYQPAASKTYIWVRATAGTTTATAEVEVNVIPRSRAVRH